MTLPNSPSDNLLPLPSSADGACDAPTTLEWRVRLLMLLVCGFWLLLAGRLVQL